MAHALTHIVEGKIGDKEVNIADNLWANEIDPQKEEKKYRKKIKDAIGEVVSSVIVEEIKKQIDAAYLSPGAEETAIFDKFIELMKKINSSYIKIVFDTAPTGHTLRLLTLPELMEDWIDRLIKKRLQVIKLMKMASRIDEALKEKVKHDPIIEILNKRKEKLLFARNYLLDKKSSCFIFVLNAERLSILETAKAISLLKSHRIFVDGIIVNKILPPTKDKFFTKRKEVQEECLKEIKSRFKKLFLGYFPLLESDIQGREVLTKMKFQPYWKNP